MPNYTIWTMHGEVSVNVLQENDDDVDMPDVAILDADKEPGVNTEPMATVNNVFRNTLADDTDCQCFEQTPASKFIFMHVRPGWCAKGHKVYTGSG